MLMGVLALTACEGSRGWERDDRFPNVPFHAGQPMQAEQAGRGLSGPGVQIRLMAPGGKPALSPEELRRLAKALMRPWRGDQGPYGGVRDERYFWLSIRPEVMVVAPFVYKISHKTAAQLQSLGQDVVGQVLNPLYEQIRQQQVAEGQGLGWLVELPGPNYVELGCSFPDLPEAMLWSPAWGQARPFDDQARAWLAAQLKLTVRRHPTQPALWQLVGCPS